MLRPLALIGLLLAAPAAGADLTASVPLGDYLVRLPDGPGPFPAVVHLHGWGASAAAVLADPDLAAIPARGYALIAPLGRPRDGQTQTNWSVRDGSAFPRDDAAFLAEVLADAAAHGWIDRDRVLLTGFSRGGSMVWDIACHHPALATAYAPVAGAFWEPLPEGCTGPVDLYHLHGWADGTVPLEGRSVGGGLRQQGDAFAALALLRAAAGPVRPERSVDGTFRRTAWRTEAGREIVLELHPGSHSVPAFWADRALDWFEALPHAAGTRP